MSNGDTPNSDNNTPPTNPPAAEQDPQASVLANPVAANPVVQNQPVAVDTAKYSDDSGASETVGSGETVAGTAAPSDPAAKPVEPATGAPKIGRSGGPLAARGLGVAKPASPSVSTSDFAGPAGKSAKKKSDRPANKPRPRLAGDREVAEPTRPRPSGRVAVPSQRDGLSDDLQAELDAELAAADVEEMLSGAAGMSQRKEQLSEGTRVQAQILKIHSDSVFVALGGPDEGVVAFEQFKEEPVIGSQIEVVVRGFNSADGLYVASLPGEAVEVSDWEDLEEGTVVEATVTGGNSGGLECKVGGMPAFIPISQIAEHRVEDTSEFVGQKFLCVVNESNARRGNLVLSRRAVLERERAEKRKEQLEKIEAGDLIEGVVRSIKDFGAFVDLGGLDGLIHISKLSWDRVGHPSDVLEVGQKVKVQVDKVDKDTGKVGLSYRDLLENPWDTAEAEFGVGSVHKAPITRVAAFGCFVKLAPGVEGLVHISELAHHRISRVDSFVSEGQEVEVKVLSFDRDAQKIGLSMKAVQAAPVETKASAEEEVDEAPQEPSNKPMHTGPLKGGNNRDTGGERFGLRW